MDMIKMGFTLPLKNEIEVIKKAKDWALMHGVAMRLRDNFDEDSVSLAPFTLLPSFIKKDNFDEAVNAQRAMSELMHRVSHDHEFLETSLKKTIQVDDFTKKLYDIYTTVRAEGFGQVLSLGIFRSDYLYDENAGRMKQVEFNTIASSFAGLSTRVSELHRYVLAEIGQDSLLHNKLPDNPALEGVCSGLVHAWQLYGHTRAVVMFLVEETTYNICDQRFMEFEIRRQQPQIQVIRRKFSQLSSARLGPQKQLLLNDGFEVAVVYMRTGYDPKQYEEGDWDIRLLMERSTALKCPSIHYQLAGTKKIQQVLAAPGMVERFIRNEEDVRIIRSLFTNIYSLDMDAEGDLAFNLVMKNPENFVLKPQREGGGNNTYGNDIPNLLNNMSPEERQSMILMQLIKPIPTKNIIVAKGRQTDVSEIISELGIFSYVIGSASEIVAIKSAGHMLRSKLATSSEGGVASGYGALDSPILN